MESGRKSKLKKKRRMPTIESFSEHEEEEAKWLLDICIAAGFSLPEIGNKQRILSLEIALDDFTTTKPIGFFMNIRTLSFSKTKLSRIEGLDQLLHLEQLWMVENNITSMDGLSQNTKLKNLNLSNNRISKIESLDNLTLLEKLWLNENNIRDIENLTTLANVTEISMASNKIREIGQGLNQCRILETLNLSGNEIGSFKEVLYLTTLPSLEHLCLADANFGENPMCNLCNYQTYVLHHLSKLKNLDTLQVSEDARQYAESTFMKKRMYYNMRIKTVQQCVTNLTNKLDEALQSRERFIYSATRELMWQSKHADKNENSDGKEEAEGQVAQFFDDMEQVGTFHRQLKRSAHMVGENVIYRLMTELDTGGNIRYEDGSKHDNWYKSCSNLIDSRFYPAQLSSYGIRSINITKVVRIHNRLQRSQFEEHLETICDVTNPNYKKSVDYLFFGDDPENPEQLFKTIETGFNLETGERIPLVNSVGLADLSRIRHFKGPDNQTLINAIDCMNQVYDGGVPIPSGHLLVCKVYIHDSVQDSERYPSNTPPEECAELAPITLPNTSVIRANTDDDNQRIWYISDELLVLPEYLIEFDYVYDNGETELGPEMAQLNNITHWFCEFAQCEQPKEPEAVTPYAQVYPKDSLKNIVHLNLINCNLTSLELVSEMAGLKELVVSFNKLTTIVHLRSCNFLKRLEAGYNKIKEVDCSQNLSLNHLELNNNFIPVESSLAKLPNSLRFLLLFCNPIAQSDSYRKQVTATLTGLEMLDYNAVFPSDKVEEETPESITAELIQANSSVSKGAHLLSIGRYHRETSEIDTYEEDWERSVEVIQLNHMTLKSLVGLKKLTGLKKATFIDNSLTSVEGLQACVLLEELSLEGNNLTSTQELSCFHYLKKLDLGKNKIQTLLGFPHLEYLTQLSMENNKIHELRYLDGLKNLMELYIGYNQLQKLKDLLNLKANPKLIILDISGNPFESSDITRMFAVYHLPKLKVLGGSPIDKNEVIEARQKFSGRLSEEVLDSKLQGPIRTIKQLDLSHLKLRDLGGLIKQDKMPMLSDLHLNDNCFVNLSCVEFLISLVSLSLSKNNLETLYVGGCDVAKGLNALPNLVTLDVSQNQLTDLNGLQYANLKELRTLRASNNMISKLEHLDMLKNLHELDLRGNKLREIQPHSFPPDNQIHFLRLEENLLTSLTYFSKLHACEALHLGNNKLKETFEIEKIAELKNLRELVMTGNPMTRKSLYRVGVLKRMSYLHHLDDKEITQDELDRLDSFKLNITPIEQQRLPPLVHYAPVPAQVKIPVKLTSVNFEGFSPLVQTGKRSDSYDRGPQPPQSGTRLKPEPFLGFMSVPISLQKDKQASFAGGFPQQTQGRASQPRSSSQNKPLGYKRKNT